MTHTRLGLIKIKRICSITVGQGMGVGRMTWLIITNWSLWIIGTTTRSKTSASIVTTAIFSTRNNPLRGITLYEE